MTRRGDGEMGEVLIITIIDSEIHSIMHIQYPVISGN